MTYGLRSWWFDATTLLLMTSSALPDDHHRRLVLVLPALKKRLPLPQLQVISEIRFAVSSFMMWRSKNTEDYLLIPLLISFLCLWNYSIFPPCNHFHICSICVLAFSNCLFPVRLTRECSRFAQISSKNSNFSSRKMCRLFSANLSLFDLPSLSPCLPSVKADLPLAWCWLYFFGLPQDLSLWRRWGESLDHAVPLHGQPALRPPVLSTAVDQELRHSLLWALQIRVHHGDQAQAAAQGETLSACVHICQKSELMFAWSVYKLRLPLSPTELTSLFC